MKIWFHTFGCRVNQYETEGLRERLMSDGVSVAVADFESADLCVLNTCTVTGEADKEALALARRISRRNPAARLVVTGCLATRDPGAIREAAPEAVIVANSSKEDIPALLGCRTVPDEAGLRSFSDHSRAFLKVQDGCNMHCTYCIIPSVRPELYSRRPEAVLSEVKTLAGNGYREIVLCGIRLGRYLAQDASGRRVDFPGLLGRVAGLGGDFRVRLSSLEITDITERLLDVFEASGGKICPSFHLPLQSGSDAVLKRMRRWYSTGFYARRLEALRRRLPAAGVFTDVMAGFPGETSGEFEESLRFVRESDFSGLHVFRYSSRDGTPASALAPVEAAETLARARRLRELDRELRIAFAASALGGTYRVLVEESGGGAGGLTEHFLRVRFACDPGAGFVTARIVSTEGVLAFGEPISPLSDSLRSANTMLAVPGV